jgi:transcriptional coactivator HFI1/ADA1
MSLLGKVCANGPGFVRTGEFKKRVARDEGEGARRIEAEERRKRRMLCVEDLQLALRLGDGYLGQTPLIAGGIYHSRCLDTEGVEDLYPPLQAGDGVGGEVWSVEIGMNGGGAVNGEPMEIDAEDGWVGGDADGLDGVLDDVLNLADI